MLNRLYHQYTGNLRGIHRAVFEHVRFEVFAAVTMKNGVFWDIKPQFIPHRRHITSPLQTPAGYGYVRFEVFMPETMKYVF
jgi:hypothetical protein